MNDERNDYYEYLTEVNINNKKIYNLNKKFEDFMNLHKNLKTEFINDSSIFPESTKIFTEEYNFEAKINQQNIKLLEIYLNEIGSHPKIYLSNKFRKFAELPKDFDERISVENKAFGNNMNNSIKESNLEKAQVISRVKI